MGQPILRDIEETSIYFMYKLTSPELHFSMLAYAPRQAIFPCLCHPKASCLATRDHPQLRAHKSYSKQMILYCSPCPALLSLRNPNEGKAQALSSLLSSNPFPKPGASACDYKWHVVTPSSGPLSIINFGRFLCLFCVSSCGHT